MYVPIYFCSKKVLSRKIIFMKIDPSEDIFGKTLKDRMDLNQLGFILHIKKCVKRFSLLSLQYQVAYCLVNNTLIITNLHLNLGHTFLSVHYHLIIYVCLHSTRFYVNSVNCICLMILFNYCFGESIRDNFQKAF